MTEEEFSNLCNKIGSEIIGICEGYASAGVPDEIFSPVLVATTVSFATSIGVSIERIHQMVDSVYNDIKDI